ncbi:MAG: hypothetical protein H7248_05545 [Microbacteriaceae bacterium]|nr:hypothetical protein [Microbacteriaceae bacterium]
MSATHRLSIAGVVLTTLLLMGVSVAFGMAPLQGWTVGLFLLLELGIAPCLLLAPMAPLWFSLLAITTSLTATVAIGFSMALSALWHPTVALWAVVIVTLGMLAVSIRRDLRVLRNSGITAAVKTPGQAVRRLTIAGVGIVLLAALAQQTIPQPGGLFSSLNVFWYLGLIVLVTAAVWAKRAASSPAFPVLALSGIVVLSQAVVYGSPAVMSAARHVGIVDYIRSNHQVNTGLDIYQAWSGLFAGIAWICDAANISDAMTVATWWPVILSPAIALATAALASRWVVGPHRIWWVAAISALTGSLNIVYFSPQSFGYFLALVIFALTLTERRAERMTLLRAPRGMVAFILLVSIIMAVSHQISPYLTVAALGVFWLFGYLRPWWMLLVVLVPALVWAGLNTAVLGRFLSIGAIGNLFQNLQPPKHSFATLPTPAVTTLAFAIPAVLLVVVGLLAVFSLLRLRTRFAWSLALAALSPATLFAATDYGQEGIFRVVLFAGPWLAILVAANAWPFVRATVPAAAAGLAVLLGVNIYGQTALDWNRVVTPDAARALKIFESSAPGIPASRGATALFDRESSVLLLTGTANAAPQTITGRYLEVQYVSREIFGRYPSSSESYDAAADVDQLTLKYEDSFEASRLFALVSTSIGAYDERYGFQSYADYKKLATAMAESPRWKPVVTGPTATLYELLG